MFQFIENICLKAPIWTDNFSIWLWENPQIPHFYDFKIFGRVPEPQNQYDLSYETPEASNESKKNTKPF